MAGTRSATKSSSPSQSSPPTSDRSNPKKRAATPTEAQSGPKRRRGRPSNAAKAAEAALKADQAKEQKTLEDTFANTTNGNEEDKKDEGNKMSGIETTDEKKSEPASTNGKAEAEVHDKSKEEPDKETNGKNGGEPEIKKSEEPAKEKNAFDEVKSDEADAHQSAEKEQDTKTSEIKANNDSVIQDSAREAAIPSSILEKGVIYFFFRARVNVDEPHGIEDLARSYMVLRPIPLGAKIGEGPLQDDGKARLLAVPKKMLPKSRQDRFLIFVEKSGVSVKELRDQFSRNEYATKTVGTSQTPSATPFAEGVYAITSSGKDSHLAYHITVPKQVGEIQKELGINEKGSFVVSVKNPEAPGPVNATLDNPAKYPKELQDQFRSLRWMPLKPELLDYEGTQILFIGEGVGAGLGRAVEESSKDKKDDAKEKPEEELMKLEEEDHDRVESLKEDDPVFADLGLSSKEWSHLETTW